MDGRKLSAVDEVEHENKGKDIAHGEHLLSEKSSGYMKKELHRHHENAGTALELFYGVLKKLSPLGLLYTCRVDIEREKTTVFDKAEFTFRGAKAKTIWTEIGSHGGWQDLSLSGRELYPFRAELTEWTELVKVFNQVHVINSTVVLGHVKRRVA